MGLSETFGEMDAKEKTLVVGGAAMVVYFLVRSVKSSGVTTGAAVVDTTAAQASQTAAAATISQTENISKLLNDQNAALTTAIQGFQADEEKHINAMQTSFTDALTKTQDNNASAIKGITDQINKMATVQPVNPSPSPMASSGSYNGGNMIIGSTGGLTVGNMGINHVTTQNDLRNVIGTSVSNQGYGLVTVKTANGTSNVLAGSVFDPTSSNFRPELN